MKNKEKYQEMYEEAGRKTVELIHMMGSENRRCIPLLLSAGWCGLKADAPDLVEQTITRLKTHKLNKVQNKELKKIQKQFKKQYN